MQDKEFYQQILGLALPWSVSEVKLDIENQQINIHVAHPEGTKFCCPQCDEALACYDPSPERQWRHLDSCQFQTSNSRRGGCEWGLWWDVIARTGKCAS